MSKVDIIVIYSAKKLNKHDKLAMDPTMDKRSHQDPFSMLSPAPAMGGSGPGWKWAQLTRLKIRI